MSVKVTVSGGGMSGRAEAAAQKATQAVMRELFGAMQQSFTAKAWEWPNETIRGGSRKGTTRKTKSGRGFKVGSPRNIIDLGNLRQSGFWTLNGYTATFSWSANYAAAVHEGYRRFRADGSFSTWPARPWTRAVLGRVNVPGIAPFPLSQRLKDVWLSYFKAGRV